MCWFLGLYILSYYLEKSSHIVGIICVPILLILGVVSQFAMLKGFACDVVHDRHGPVQDEFAGGTSLGRLAGFHHNMMDRTLCD